jgi:acylphosphatase
VKHLSIKISGIVQGVFFRASTKDAAERLGISGFVRNEPDGSVYIEAEGEEEKLTQFMEWCRHGPPRASVEKCEIIEGETQGYISFQVKR